MDKLFFSKDNFNLLAQIINQKVKEQHDINLDPSYNKIIFNGMNHVYQNVNPKPPNNIPVNKYLDLMNIKCLSIVIPAINKRIGNARDPKQQEFTQTLKQQQSQQYQQRKNDYNQQYKPETLPLPQMNNYRDNISEQYESLQNVRDQEFPQVEQPTITDKYYSDITDKKQELPSMEATNADFNRRLQERNIQLAPTNDANYSQPVQASMHHSQEVPQPSNEEMSELDMQRMSQTLLPSEISNVLPRELLSGEQQPNAAPFHDSKNEEFLQRDRIRRQQYQRDKEEREEHEEKIKQREQVLSALHKEYHIDQKRENIKTDLREIKDNIINPEIQVMQQEQIQRIKDNERTLAYNSQSLNNTVSPVIFPQKPQYVKRIQYFTVDSRDRDLEIYPSASFFQVKFAPASDDIITKSINVRSETHNIIYVIREDVSGERGASISKHYDNIYHLQCTQALVPLESIYVCGICPNRYYDNRIDTNCYHDNDADPTDTKDRVIPVKQYTYEPIWNNKIGIQTTVLDIPYLLLNVDELESYSPYGGTNTPNRNAFAKLVYDTNFGVLSPFIKMSTSDTDEYYTYSPTALGRLDKMTLFLSTPEGEPFFFGRDKLFIDRFEKSPNFLKNCPSTNFLADNVGVSATRIYINTEETFCKCTFDCNCGTQLKSHCLKPGDLIYLYNTRPCKPVYVMFHDETNQISYNNFRLIINSETDTTVNLSINIIVDMMNNIEEPIDFNKFLQVNNYLALLIENHNEFFNILELDGTNITIEKNETVDLMEGLPISKVGYAKQNNKGFQTKNRTDLTFQGGVRVCSVGDSSICKDDDTECIPGNPNCENYDPNNPGSKATPFGFEAEDPTKELYFDIDYPFDNIPLQLIGESYKSGQIFLIKQKLQISYTFKVVTLEKDYNVLESLLVGP